MSQHFAGSFFCDVTTLCLAMSQKKTKFSLRSLSIAQDWVSHVVNKGDTVIDATVGNGHDTLFLAQAVGTGGKVIGFDVQAEATDQTRALLVKQGVQDGVDFGECVSLHTVCHSQIYQYIQEEISAAMFNLGYLPLSDKSVITQTDTTLKAIQQCLDLLAYKGIVTIVCYPGHEGGADEAQAVDDWAQSLPTPAYTVLKAVPHNPRSPAPYLIGIQKGR